MAPKLKIIWSIKNVQYITNVSILMWILFSV